jgi:hypothetical protein
MYVAMLCGGPGPAVLHSRTANPVSSGEPRRAWGSGALCPSVPYQPPRNVAK